MLKPGGVLRMTTPDLDLLIQAYINNNMNKFINDQPEFYKTVDSSAKLAMIMFGATGEDCTYENYEGHFFCYTQKSMTTELKNSGFKDIEFYYETGKSKNTILAKEVTDKGMSHSFVVEAIK